MSNDFTSESSYCKPCMSEYNAEQYAERSLKRKNIQLPEARLCPRCETPTTNFTPLATYCRPCMRDYHIGRYGPKTSVAARPVHLACLGDSEITSLCKPKTAIPAHEEWTHAAGKVTCHACITATPDVETPKQIRRKAVLKLDRIPVDPFEAAMFGKRS